MGKKEGGNENKSAALLFLSLSRFLSLSLSHPPYGMDRIKVFGPKKRTVAVLDE